MFERCDDPPCPRCGCGDCPEVVGRRGRLNWGLQYADGEPLEATDEGTARRPARAIRRQCQHCRHVFMHRDEGAATATADAGEVLHAVLRCPYCHSHRHHVTRTVARTWTRYHLCDDCGLTFKSRSV